MATRRRKARRDPSAARIRLTWEDGDAHVSTLTSFLRENPGLFDAADLRDLRAGKRVAFGGGAAPRAHAQLLKPRRDAEDLPPPSSRRTPSSYRFLVSSALVRHHRMIDVRAARLVQKWSTLVDTRMRAKKTPESTAEHVERFDRQHLVSPYPRRDAGGGVYYAPHNLTFKQARTQLVQDVDHWARGRLARDGHVWKTAISSYVQDAHQRYRHSDVAKIIADLKRDRGWTEDRSGRLILA